MKTEITPQAITNTLIQGVTTLAQCAIKAEAPKIYIKHLVNAINELAEAQEIYEYYDSQRSNQKNAV